MIGDSRFFVEQQIVECRATSEDLFRVVTSIGGDNGWFYADWLWKIRGFLDKQLGGVGLRTDRKRPRELVIGETLDFWRVDDYQAGQRLLLRAEMKVWGHGWLEFLVQPLNGNQAMLTQIARYSPQGIFGLLYWWLLYPVHKMIFRGMAKAIAHRAESARSESGYNPY
jgi:hypothetical protein